MMLMRPAMFSFSYPTGEPQTPTRTPTTTAFDSFTTPKLESSFFDPRVTWDTADPYASSPEFLRSPQKFGIGTPSNGLRPEVPKDGRASEQTNTARRIRSVKPLPSVVEDGPQVGSAKSAASMQTPPPTSASRRKIPDFETVNGSARGNTPRMGNHLETPSRLMGASPRMFGNLHSSPDLFQLASMDPSASPFFPQQRLFWDQDHEQVAADIPLPGTGRINEHVQRPTSQSSMNIHIPQLPTIDGTMDLPDFGGFGISSAPPTDAALFPAPFSTSPRIPVAKAEDPSMFLSSPARRFGGPQLTPERRPLGMRQPYHHQTEESKREEFRRAQGGEARPPRSYSSFSEDETEDDDFTPRGRPGLTRSVTHTAITSSSHRPLSQAGGMMASTSGIRKSPSKGGASPAKNIRPTPLGRSNSVATGLPTRSSSVVLRIGRDGRAKTEMQPVDEGPSGLTDPLTGMDLDGSATESEVDPAEYSDYPVLPRAQSSFGLFDGSQPPLCRSDSGSRPPSKGSYTSISSSHSGRMSPWTGSSRGVSGRSTYRGSPDAIKRTPKRHSSFLPSDASYTRGSVASQTLPGDEDDNGDATHALRQVLKDRGRGPRPSTGGYGARLPRSSHTFTHLTSSPPRLNSDFDIHPRHSNASPTTLTDPDLATPSTDRNISNPSNGTRCICNSMDNGGHLMIQCESCNHWLHTKCVGLERANLPSFYVCMFCDHTPSRQNRVRSSYGPGGGPPSPLAHKSYRFR
ncbi:Zinc finger PHD-finger [Penicillium cinerascens]|uniref:Zinc finger PHD-finger n=1 Tax=Penicillium cinerascens TaxID=70096 RepID=A0A9W9MPC6_9EURO|nr:Zinc finger PHD-finger [Penicillium cinerascens]KAJ5205032.1 Zinc finger PHD-finger [Penicillium cinerascens]